MLIELGVITTKKYRQFAQPFLDSADRHFFPDDKIMVTFFTDQPLELVSKRAWHRQIPITSYGFPEATLFRYKIFWDHRDEIAGDWLFYSDVDMRFNRDIGHEILPDASHGVPLVVVRHKNNDDRPGPWENRRLSTAYVPKPQQGVYFAGGFQGGSRDAYLTMCRDLKTNIKTDEARSVLAIWHDESHLNAYMTKFPRRSYVTLDTAYCYPEDGPLAQEAYIHALIKDHAEMRS